MRTNMKDEDWVDTVVLSSRQRYQALNYMELDDDTLQRVRDESRKEWDRRQKERFDDLVEYRRCLEIRKEIQGE